MNHEERTLLETIDRMLIDSRVATQINHIADRVEQNHKAGEEPISWEPVPLQIYRDALPQQLRSSWVFLLQEGSTSGAERHPNSHQRVRSWRRSGDFQVWVRDHWESHILQNRFDLPVEEQWASIPANVWHQAVVPAGQDWIVVSFHTVDASELIEERPDPVNARGMVQRTYLGR